jgi:hypothetical protein
VRQSCQSNTDQTLVGSKNYLLRLDNEVSKCYGFEQGFRYKHNSSVARIYITWIVSVIAHDDEDLIYLPISNSFAQRKHMFNVK